MTDARESTTARTARRGRHRAGAVAAALVLALALVAGCSGQDASEQFDEVGRAVDEATPGEDALGDIATEAAPSAGGGQVPEVAERRRIRTAEVRLVVPLPEDVEGTADNVALVATEVGGVVDDDERTAGTDARAVLVLRVPPDELETAIDRVAELADVRSRSIATDDVTSQYTDLEGRIATLEASVERLRALIAEADDVVQIAALEGELTDREAQLESAVGQLRVLTEQTDLATLTVSIVPEEDAPAEDDDDGAPSPLEALENGWDAFVGAVLWTVAVLLTLLPFLVALAVAGLLARWGARRWRARHPKAPTPPTRPAPPVGTPGWAPPPGSAMPGPPPSRPDVPGDVDATDATPTDAD